MFVVRTALLFLSVCITASVYAQTPGGGVHHPAWGVFGAVNYNLHRADFRALPGVPSCCPLFENGNGIAGSAGVLYETPLSPGMALQLRAGLFAGNAALTARQYEPVIIDGRETGGVFEHTVEARFFSVAFEPLVRIRLAGELSLLAGGHAGFVPGGSYSQKEEIVEPVDRGVFTDTGTRRRNENSGSLPDASPFEAALVAGVGYALPLNRTGTLHLVPEVMYTFGLTDVVRGLSWQVNTLRAGVSVVLTHAATPAIVAPPPVVAPPVTPPPPAPPALSAQVDAVGLLNGREVPAALRIEEFVSTQMYPLLNYIFFDEGTPALPDRYQLLTGPEAERFRVEDNVGGEAVDVYHHLLNIVGRRLREHPGATLTLTGCNADVGPEKNNVALSRSRAEQVRRYLTSVWGIDSTRLKTEVRNLPATPSNPRDADGVVENRRVELRSSDERILAPIVLNDTIRMVEPPVIRFRPTVTAAAGTRSWTVTLASTGGAVQRWNGTGVPDTACDWQTADAVTTVRSDLRYSVRVEDATGRQVAPPEKTVPVEYISVGHKRQEGLLDKELSVYRLILFDFDRADITGANQRIIDFIRQRTNEAADIHIAGSTDRIGDAGRNRELSAARAQAAAQALGLESTTDGTGASVLLYDNNLPEGRFYSRTVTIRVENPVK